MLRVRPRSASSNGASIPDLLRGAMAKLHARHRAVETTVELLADLARRQKDADDEALPLPPQLLPLREDLIELDLNRVFEGTFEHCASSARDAVDSLEPLLSAATSKV